MAQPGARRSDIFFLVWLCIVTGACNTDKSQSPAVKLPEEKSITVPVFNSDSAYAYIARQVEFGPRVPNTASHRNCGDWLIEKLGSYCDTVIVQSYQVRAFDGKMLNSRNIIASFNPETGNRILLAAHWDTRPFADQDSVRRNEPIDGANDGGSGVGILLEVARQLKAADAQFGVDIILFDAEDYGQPDDSDLPPVEDSYCLGSQYWSKNLHVRNYTARFGVLLDMAGAHQSVFTQEGTSRRFAPEVVNMVWQTAGNAGFSDYFVFEATKPIVDDHFYINQIARIKCIDIIHYDHNTPTNFWKHWHTHGDTMDKIDRNTLRAVGQTLLEVLYRRQS